ncbi:Ig-like domain-containing protein [Hymenobacter mucosus]|nr:Ig-like domain-containing protein [Hymenobacter mucosus]
MSARASLVLLLTAAAGLGGCAAISSPEGGPRDVEVPKLVSSIPANGARNVKAQSVRLIFSEQVQVKDLQKNLIIAPLISNDNPYKVREDRTSITLLFDKPFAPNTTYSFNFGNSISDITESNIAAKAVVSFSTGAQLDSGSVRGLVTEPLSGQPVGEASVLLYPTSDTTTVRTGKPYYLARTDKAGAYEFQNLKEGSYRIFAILDKNQSSRYEDGERIAYLPEPIIVRPGLDSLNLLLTRPDQRRALVTGQKPGPTDFRVSFNEGVEKATITPLGAATAPANLNDAIQFAERGRTAILFRTAALAEGRYLLASTDSAGNTGRDTISVRFQGTAPTRRGALYSVEGSPREVYRQGQVKFEFTEPIRIAANKPFAVLTEDSVKQRPLRLPQDGALSLDRSTLTIPINTKARKTISILLDSTAIESVTGRRLGIKPLRLRVSEQATTGTLSGPIRTKYTRYIVQLLDANGQVLASLDSPKATYHFDYLAPGPYKLRVLIDANQDGRWQGGDPEFKRLPEPVYLLPKPIQVRANWDQVETLSF